jgi:hypothetical protein
MKEFVRLMICIVGLSLMCTLFTDILLGWHIFSSSLNLACVIIPVLVVFIIKELAYSPYIKDNPDWSPKVFYTLDKMFEILVLILSILLIISIPFVWYAVIDATIGNAK